jgi:Tol biopolymer transport system component
MRRFLPIALILAALLTGVEATQAQYFRYGKNKVHYAETDWSFIQSRHFTVYYYDDPVLADFAARAAEEAFAPMASLFRLQPERRISMIVYPNHAEFAVTNAVDLPTFSDGIGGVTELFKNRIAVPFAGDYRDFRRVLHHELVHAVINEVYYGGSIEGLIKLGQRMRIPNWFNEGLAEYLALGWDTQSDMYIRESIINDHLPDIDQLGGYMAYRGGQAVWDYVAEQYGQEKIAEILRRLRTARSVDQAFQRSIGLSVEELSAQWKRALREIHFPEVTARESLDEIGQAVITERQGWYNASPALSPLGDQLAFVSTTSGLFDIYIANAHTGEIIKRLVQGQLSREFESLRILTPGLSWSPDGRTLAAAVRSGRSDAIVLINVRTEQTERIELPALKQILSLSWSPDGTRMALSAIDGVQSDIWLLTLESRTVENLTGDIWSDFEPAWSPDGDVIVFHSDRGAGTELHRFTKDDTALLEETFDQLDLYLLRPGARFARRLTVDEMWDDRSARFGADPDRVVFVSDRNGIENLYEKHLETGRVRPLTDLDVGVMQVAVAAGSDLAALVSLRRGVPSIYTLRLPFQRNLPRDPLIPNVWAQRVDPNSFQEAPALSVAGRTRRDANPFLRDASDGMAYLRGRQRVLPLEHPEVDPTLPPLDSLLARLPEAAVAALASDSRRPADLPVDSFVTGLTIDYATLTRSNRPVLDPVEALESPLTGPYVDTDGRFIPRDYKLRFSPDIVYGAAGYDAIYGVQGVTQMRFSDMLGDHRIVLATNLLLDLRNSDYQLSYQYLPRRTDWSVSGFHVSRLLADFTEDDPTYFRYRQFGGNLNASYPIDKFHRLDLDLGVVGVNQADVTDITVPSISRSLLLPRITFTRDVTTPGFLSPVDGGRVAVSASGAPVSFQDRNIRFATLLFDARLYQSFGRGMYTWALRFSAGSSFGRTQQVFYTSGVQNWLNRRFDEVNGFPIEEATDFVFATPMMPLRGFEINAANGSHFGLLNFEFRFPLLAAALPGPLPFLPFYHIHGQVFADVGNVWGGRSSTGRPALPGAMAPPPRDIEDFLAGTGFGLRSLFLGLPVRLDFAWPFDGRTFGERHVYLSIGLDF